MCVIALASCDVWETSLIYSFFHVSLTPTPKAGIVISVDGEYALSGNLRKETCMPDLITTTDFHELLELLELAEANQAY